MSIPTPWYRMPAAQAAAGDPAGLLRLARNARQMSLQEAGRLCGYSGSTMSRFETGRRKLTDVRVLRRLAAALDIPPDMLGLAVIDSPEGDASAAKVPDRRTTDGGDMHRRHLLASVLATLAASPAVDGLLSRPPPAGTPPVPLDQLRGALTIGWRDFDEVRYEQLAQRLPDLIRTAVATRDAVAYDRRAEAEGVLAVAYDLATRFMINMHHNDGAMVSADQASRAARASGDPTIIAQTDRTAAIVMRRTHDGQQAQQALLDAAVRLETNTGLADRHDATLYAGMLATAAYTAAIADRRDDALTLLGEAEVAIVGRAAGASFTPNDLTLYKAGVARLLGDYGHAVDLMSRVRLDLLPTPERQARYWEDMALSWMGRGRPVPAYEALREAERAAPQEVRYRPWAKKLTGSLVAGDVRGELPDLCRFAARIGAPA